MYVYIRYTIKLENYYVFVTDIGTIKSYIIIQYPKNGQVEVWIIKEVKKII